MNVKLHGLKLQFMIRLTSVCMSGIFVSKMQHNVLKRTPFAKKFPAEYAPEPPQHLNQLAP